MNRRPLLAVTAALFAGCNRVTDQDTDRDPYTADTPVDPESEERLELADDVDVESCLRAGVTVPDTISSLDGTDVVVPIEDYRARHRWEDDDLDGTPIVRTRATDELADFVRVDVGVWSSELFSVAFELYPDEPVADDEMRLDANDFRLRDQSIQRGIDEAFETGEAVTVDEGAEDAIIELSHAVDSNRFGIERDGETLYALVVLSEEHDLVEDRYEYAAHYAVGDAIYRTETPGELDHDGPASVSADAWIELDC